MKWNPHIGQDDEFPVATEVGYRRLHSLTQTRVKDPVAVGLENAPATLLYALHLGEG